MSKSDFVKLCQEGKLTTGAHITEQCKIALSQPALFKPPPKKPPQNENKQSVDKLPTLTPLFKSYLPMGCQPSPKALFVRSDALDNFNYLLTLLPQPSNSPLAASGDANASPNSLAKGLSISYTNNYQSKTQATGIDGRISYLLFGAELCDPPGSVDRIGPDGKHYPGPGDPHQTFVQDVAFAPFVGSNGSWNEPITAVTTTATTSKKAVEGTTSTRSNNGLTTTTVVPAKGGSITTVTKKYALSALTFGADFQFDVSTIDLPISQHFFYISPYYQSDYIGAAQIEGVNFSYEPVLSHVLNDGIINSGIYFYTGFRAEADFSNVTNPGLTLQTKGEHAWLGETLRPTLTLFPLVDTPTTETDDWFTTWVSGRFSLIGTQKYFWDAATKQGAQYYQAILQYKLGACRVDPTAAQLGSPCTIAGSSAISFEYDWGTDINTLIKQNQWKVVLSYSY